MHYHEKITTDSDAKPRIYKIQHMLVFWLNVSQTIGILPNMYKKAFYWDTSQESALGYPPIYFHIKFYGASKQVNYFLPPKS